MAVGCHQDDMLHTAVGGLFYQGRLGSMHARWKLGKMPLTIIRPLCMMNEADIKAFANLRGYQDQKKQCPNEHDSHRTAIRRLFSDIEAMNPEARANLWRALDKAGKLVEE